MGSTGGLERPDESVVQNPRKFYLRLYNNWGDSINDGNKHLCGQT